MKIIKFAAVFLMMIVSILSVSCTSSVEPIDPAVLNPNIDPNTPVAGAFKVDFNDQTFNSTTAGAVITGTKITIAALNSTTGENFTINLTGITTGEYSTTDKVSVLYKKAVSDSFGFLSQNTIGSTATVKVTSINSATKRIKGTFKFIGNWNDSTNATPPAAIQFLNGTFDVPFTTPDEPTASFFKVDFNGQTFNATTKTAVIGNGKIEIAGIRGANSETVGITIQGTTAGSYTTASTMGYLDNTMVDYQYSSIKLVGNNLVNTANVTITSINTTTKIITGTFNFIGHWSDFSDATPPTPIEFTNGSFSLPYTDATIDPNPLNGTFTATVDGQQYVANEVIAVQALTGGGSFSITGNINNGLLGKSMTILFHPDVDNIYLLPEQGTITYVPNVLALQSYTPVNFNNPQQNVGVLNITTVDEVNKKISGTFSSTVFLLDTVTQTVIGQKEITNGVFTNVTYTIN